MPEASLVVSAQDRYSTVVRRMRDQTKAFSKDMDQLEKQLYDLLSTHAPTRGRQPRVGLLKAPHVISIHAPREGGDLDDLPRLGQVHIFRFTPPRAGGRLLLFGIEAIGSWKHKRAKGTP